MVAAWGCESSAQVPSDTAVQTGAVEDVPETGSIESPSATGGVGESVDGTGDSPAAAGCGSVEPFKPCETDAECTLGTLPCGRIFGLARISQDAYSDWRQACRQACTLEARPWPETEDGNAVVGDAQAVVHCVEKRCIATVDAVRDPTLYLSCGYGAEACLIEDYCITHWTGDEAAPEFLRAECGAGRGCLDCDCLRARGEPLEGCECRDVLDDVEVRCWE